MKKRLSVTVSGRVQGVFFRNAAKGVADALGVVGIAKNLSDGRVSMVAEGEEVLLRKFLDWCYRGSFLASVEGLAFNWEDAKDEFTKFIVERRGGTVIEDKLLALKNLSHKLLASPIDVVPKHVVVIPDGNRRWAREHNLPGWRGHERGLNRAVDLLKEMKKRGVKFFTLWGFSTDNWKRDDFEVRKLMELFRYAMKKFRKEAIAERIRFRHFGRKDRLPQKLVEEMEALERDTAGYKDFHFGLALDYGGRDEIIRAMQKLHGEENNFSEEALSRALDTDGFPDPDLIIRTSGEQRISGVMPWQSVYSELYFATVHFPDFDNLELQYALQDFSYRERRFGGK